MHGAIADDCTDAGGSAPKVGAYATHGAVTVVKVFTTQC